MKTRQKISGSSLILMIVAIFIALIIFVGCIVLRIWVVWGHPARSL